VDFGSDPERVDYARLHDGRLKLLRKAYERSNISKNPDYQRFLQENNWWLADYALFMAVKHFFGEQPWTQWPQDIRLHWGFALDYYRRELYFDVEFQQYLQYQFFSQWDKLKTYVNKKHIRIVGDIPIYVSPDSADVWAHPELFQLDEDNVPTAVAGCPPDAFAADGQLWGNPLYRWEYHKSTGYDWWVSRMRQSFRLYDVVRVDHFRGFDEYFSIPAGSKTALTGHWEKGPGVELFRTIEQRLGNNAIMAEDLGTMTDSVRQLVKDSGYPNMKVLEFAFDVNDVGASNDYLPHNYDTNCFVYTGTHDNETMAGWLQGRTAAELEQIREYLDDQTTPAELLYKKMIRLAMMSVGRTCVIPVQDYLGLDNESRTNMPGTVDRNWAWRMKKGAITPKIVAEMLDITRKSGRFNWDTAKTSEEKTEK